MGGGGGGGVGGGDGGTNFSHYPMDGKPEIAFAGKSNVGKSTLINAILGRKALARTSSQPEKHAPSIFMV